MADGSFVREARDLVTALVDFLDELEADPDLEPSLGDGWHGGDDREQEDDHNEPSLGWTDREAMRGRYGGINDLELDRSDDEPSLGARECSACAFGWPDGPNPTGDQTDWAAGNRRDLEDEHDGSEPDTAA